ncbi:hypothetical protein ONZ45_g15944 [Pleurotus djamor]|nr:hypothetical protein ONZ45_g15944 [Pleurotus djamor]
MSTPERILVTGASGYLGSHVVKALIDAGYSVRATARAPRVQALQEAYSVYNATESSKAEVVQLDDIVHGTFPEVFAGVSGVIHVASPLAGREGPDTLFISAVEGTRNVLRQAEKSGITRIVVTSSVAALRSRLMPSPSEPLRDTDWNTLTKEEAIASGNDLAIYAVSKTLAEKAVWEFGDAHPHVEITTINPPFLYGPFAPTQKFPKRDLAAFSSNGFIYSLLSHGGNIVSTSDHADVRDVARAHVLALKSPPTSVVGRKRLPFASPNGLVFGEILKYLATQRPELKDRLTKKDAPRLSRDRAPVDFDRIKEVLGMEKSDFHKVEDTILESVDQFIEFERAWKASTSSL